MKAIQRRFSRRKKPIGKRFRTNQYIRVPEVSVIDSEGNNLGVMQTEEAIMLAQEQGLDLIEVSPVAQPPVCRIMSMGQWQYQQSQKQKNQKTLDTKVIRLTFKIGDHDRDIRLNQAKKFLEKGHKVKLELRLKGREKAYPQKGREKVTEFIKELGPDIVEDQSIKMQGMAVNALVSKKGN